MAYQSARIEKIHIVILFMISAAVFSPSLTGGFLWDDEFLITHNPAVKSLKRLPSAFSRSFFDGASETRTITYYRPLVTVINALQYSVFGLRPFWWRLFNLLLHAVNAVLFYVFTKSVMKIDHNKSFLSALLYGVHPVHAEAVCFISGRTDVLALFFIWGALFLYFNKKGGNRFIRVSSIFFFILGLLSKELVLMFPFAVIAVQFARSEESNVRTWMKKSFPPLMIRLLPYLIVSVIYVVIRFTFIRGIETPGFPSGAALTTWLTMPKVFLRYVWIIFSLMDTSCDYTNFFRIETSPFSFGVWAPALVILGIIFLTIFLFAKNRKAFAGIFWFLIFLFPVLNVFPLGIWMAERYLYIPLLGFSLAFASLEWKIKKEFIPLQALLVIVIFGFMGSFQRSFLWRDAGALWKNAVMRNPQNPQARVIYAEILTARGEFSQAEKQLEQARGMDAGEAQRLPDSLSLAKARTLAKIHKARKQYDKALEWALEAEKILPRSAQNESLKGGIFLERKDYEKAREAYETALEIDPELLSALSGLMEAKNAINAPAREILSLAERAIRINPDFALSYLYRGKALSELGDWDRAKSDFETFIRMAPDAPEGYLFLADLYEKMGAKNKNFILKAMKTYDALLARHPDNIEGLNNLGILFAIVGEKQKAEELWNRVLQIAPQDQTAKENLRKIKENPE